MFKTVMCVTLLSASFVAMSGTKTLAALNFSGGGYTTSTYKCSDGKDNDGDSKKDYNATVGAGDPGCANLSDNDETNSTTTTTTTAFASSTTTLDVSTGTTLDVPTDTCGDNTPYSCPPATLCSGFGKQARNPDKFEETLECLLTDVTVGVRCINRGDNALSANFNAVFLNSAVVGQTTFDPSNVDKTKGIWSAEAFIPGWIIAGLVVEAGITNEVCPNVQNWEIDLSTARILQAVVTENTYLEGVLQNTLPLGICVFIDDLTGYSCSQ